MWLTATGNSLTYLTKANKSWTLHQSRELPSYATMRRWMKEELPRAKIELIAQRMGIPPAWFNEDVPSEHFRTRLIDRNAETAIVLPTRKRANSSDLLRSLRKLIEFNTNIRRALQLIIVGPITVDSMTDQLNVSLIQIREMVGSLLEIDVVTASSTGGSALISLSATARREADAIQEVLDDE